MAAEADLLNDPVAQLPGSRLRGILPHFCNKERNTMSMRTRLARHFGFSALAILGGTLILAAPAHAGFNGFGLRGGWNFDTMENMKGDAFEGSFQNQTGYNTATSSISDSARSASARVPHI